LYHILQSPDILV